MVYCQECVTITTEIAEVKTIWAAAEACMPACQCKNENQEELLTVNSKNSLHGASECSGILQEPVQAAESQLHAAALLMHVYPCNARCGLIASMKIVICGTQL